MRLSLSPFGTACLAAFALGLAAFSSPASARSTLIRFPNVHDTRVVFVAAGNLWIASRAGGKARKLTDDAGEKILPRFSPDGRFVAYTATSPGNQDVYAVPSTGGTPRRLTFRSSPTGPGTTNGPEDNVVATWTPDSADVVFLSVRASWNSSDYRAFRVPVTGGLPLPLPLKRSGMLTYAPDGGAVAFTRGLTDFLTRKRYDGGLAQVIRTYAFASKTAAVVASGAGTSTDPMWFGRKIYFRSDRDAARRANIWVYDIDAKTTREVTHFVDFDVDVPSLGGHEIAFQQAGRLWMIDLPTETVRAVDVNVSDSGARTAPRDVAMESAVRDQDAITGRTDFTVSPHGEHVVFSARGTLFAVAPTGAARDLTRTVAIDNDHPAISPDGRLVAYTTDANGQEQIAIRPLGDGPPRTLTHFARGTFFTPTWSPDGTSLAVADVGRDLRVVRLDGRAPTLVAHDSRATILDACFSPDGAWLAYSSLRQTGLRAIHLHELATGRDTTVSALSDDDREPEFSPNGKYLYFVSRRRPLPFVSEQNRLDLAAIDADGVYVATLDASSMSPFSADISPPSRTESPTSPVHIDLEGLMRRAVPVPVAPGGIVSLAARGDRLFYQTQPPQLIDGDLPGVTAALRVYDLTTRTDASVLDAPDAYALSSDGSTLVYARDGKRHIMLATTPGSKDRLLDLTSLRVRVAPRAEWAAMVDQAWRIERDAFFDAKTGGVDWLAVRARYRRYIPLLGSRDDCTYLIGEMIGELGSSHTFVGFGDHDDERAPVATSLLGADYALDNASGRYRFAMIYRGDGSRPAFRSPLDAPGTGIEQGDFLLAVDGRELRQPTDPDSLLVGTKSTVALTIARSADGPRRTVIVTPLSSEFGLRRFDWIERNRGLVDRLSGGRLAYVDLSDFFDAGTRDFYRQYYGQTDKAGLIVDVRWNAGGFTSQYILDTLRRIRVGGFVDRDGVVEPLPSGVISGPKAVVINEYASSDGDQFPYFFREYGLGPVVGTRTWGGVRGLDGRWQLLDGGFVTAPNDGLVSVEGKPIIENRGVTPDIDVDTAPGSDDNGDAQLAAAVAALMRRLPGGT